jgi:hypothetical protein
MIKLLLTGLALLLPVAIAGETVGDTQASAIVDLFDGARGDTGSETVIRVESASGGANIKRFRVLDDGGQSSLVEFLDPLQRGTKVLATGSDLWFFTPRTRRAVKIPPLQRLLGDASYGDIARLKLAADYSPSSAPVAAENGLLRIELAARSPAATYARVVLFVRADDNVPVRAHYHVASGKHFRTVEFVGAARNGGQLVNDHWRIFAPETPTRQTQIHIEQARSKALPASLFTRRTLEEG